MNPYQQMEAIRKRWTPPRELLHSPPRQVQLSGAGKVLAGLGILLVAGALIGGPLLAREALRQAADSRAFRSEARETEARVLRLWQRKGENKRYMVEYTFMHDGRSYWNESRVSSSQWKKLREDSPLPVTFLPSNPLRNHPSGRVPGGMPIWVPIVVIAATLALAALIWMGLRRSRELLEYGRVAPAVITQIQKVRTEHGTTARIFKYEFPLASGALAKGKSSCDRKNLAPGSVMPVVYDPNYPRRSAMYPMPLVKVRREG